MASISCGRKSARVIIISTKLASCCQGVFAAVLFGLVLQESSNFSA